MDVRKYKAKSGRIMFMPTINLVKEMDDHMQGFCIACGEIQEGIEPDALRYECECCGESRVYGAEELVLRGLVFTP